MRPEASSANGQSEAVSQIRDDEILERVFPTEPGVLELYDERLRRFKDCSLKQFNLRIFVLPEDELRFVLRDYYIPPESSHVSSSVQK